MGNKTNQIATQLEAKTIGGGNSDASSTKCVTRTFAESVGCTVNLSQISYLGTQLVRYSDLSKYVDPEPIPTIKRTSSKFLDVLSVGNTPAERILYAERCIQTYWVEQYTPIDGYHVECVDDVTNTIQSAIFSGYLNELGQSYVALGDATNDFTYLYKKNSYFYPAGNSSPLYKYKDNISLSCCTTAFEVYFRTYLNDNLTTMLVTLYYASGEHETVENDMWEDVIHANTAQFSFNVPNTSTNCLQFRTSRGILYCSNATVDIGAIDDGYRGNIVRIVWKPDETLNLNEQIVTCIVFDFGYNEPCAIFFNYDETNAESKQNLVGQKLDKKLGGMSIMGSLQDMEFIMKTSSTHDNDAGIYATIVPMISPWSIDTDDAPCDITPLIGAESVQDPFSHSNSLSFIHDSSICGTINMPYLPFINVTDDSGVVSKATVCGMLDYTKLSQYGISRPDDSDTEKIYHYGFAFKYRVPNPNNGLKERFYLDAIQLIPDDVTNLSRDDAMRGMLNFKPLFGYLTGEFENGPFGNCLFSGIASLTKNPCGIDTTTTACGLEGFDFDQMMAIENALNKPFKNPRLGITVDGCRFIQAKTMAHYADDSVTRIVVVDFTELYKSGYASQLGPLSIFEAATTSPFNTDLYWPIRTDDANYFSENTTEGPLTLIYFSVSYGSHLYSFVLNFNNGTGVNATFEQAYRDMMYTPYSYNWLYKDKKYYLTNQEKQSKTSQFETQATVYDTTRMKFDATTGMYDTTDAAKTTIDTSELYGLVNYPYA